MKKSVRVIVPATSANCGPGFDVLGAACNLYNEFTYELTERGFELEVTGEGSGRLHASGKNLAFLAFFRLWNELTDRRYTGLKVAMHNRIPLSRGLGSSSTAIVAGLMAANYLTGSTLTRQQLVDYATEIEGHPDNVAPALLGGFTVSYMAHGKAASLRFVPKKPLSFIAAVPAEPLSTARARQAIPETVSHKDAVFNAGRSALLVSALLTGEYKFLPDALEDRLHQPYRMPLINGTQAVFKAAKNAGAYGAIISGAGSTLMAYAAADADSEAIGRAMQQAFKKAGQQAVYHVLKLDEEGARVIDN